MSHKKADKPEFHKVLSNPDFFPECNKSVKTLESSNYWIFKTGKKIFKVKKRLDVTSNASLDLAFCLEVASSINAHSPMLKTEVKGLIKQDETYLITDPDSTDPSGFALIVMNQIADHLFLDRILQKGKPVERQISQVAGFLSLLHQSADRATARQAPSIDAMKAQLADAFYQSKKYLDLSITMPMIDMIQRPMEKQLEQLLKKMSKRVKKGYVLNIHGDFTPRKLILHKDQTAALGKSSDPFKNRFADQAQDVASMMVELIHEDRQPIADLFLSAYQTASGDQGLAELLPYYSGLHCLKQGVRLSEQAGQDSKNSTLVLQAKSYYELCLKLARPNL